MSRFRARIVVLTLVLIALPAAAMAEDWGTLSGRFVFQGTRPKLRALVINKDVAVCEKHKPKNESILIDAKGGIQNIVIYIRANTARGKEGVPVAPIHPSYAATAKDKVKLDNKGCRFEPHIALLRTTQMLVLGNSDPVGHNSFLTTLNNGSTNPLIASGASVEVPLKNAERIPASVSCNIHPWMKGYIVVRPDPYMTVSGKDGTFTIKNIPAGKHTFQFWHEKLAYVKKMTLGGKSLSNRKGLHKLTIKPGENNLGDIVVKASDYKRKLK